MMTYKVKGLDRFLNNVKKKPAEARIAVDGVLNRSSLRVEKKARSYAPVDTGWLSETIYSAKNGPLYYVIKAPVHYAIYVELGTRKMAPQPYMYPALTEEYPFLFRTLEKMFKK